jgi:hypothetical protein
LQKIKVGRQVWKRHVCLTGKLDVVLSAFAQEITKNLGNKQKRKNKPNFPKLSV